MRAVQYDNYGGPEVLYLADIPTPAPGPGQLQVRVKAASVNPADAKWRSGMFKDWMPINLPHIPGYDIAGTVEAVGAGVTDFKPGDRITGLMGNLTHGAYAEVTVLDAASCAKLPDKIDFALGASLPVAALTAAQMIEEHIKPAKGETILVTGALGAVGRFLVHIALAHGAKVIAAVRPQHADEAKKLGASATIPLDGNAHGVTFDHVADTIGGPLVAALCKQIKAGKYICTAATDPIDPTGLAVAPVMVMLHPDGPRLAQIAKEVAAGAVTLPIARRMPLTAANAQEAQILQAKGGQGGKIILEP
jgi:NADPH:quinone reductase-like Zn-dependent oxidoreductase